MPDPNDSLTPSGRGDQRSREDDPGGEGILADYSSDAVLFMPTGPLKGPDAMKPLFQTIFSEFAKPGASFVMRLQCVEGDYAYILWNAETEDNYYDDATDTFVVRNGKIVAQSFAGKITPKS